VPHRATGRRLRVAVRTPPPRHALPPRPYRRALAAFLSIFLVVGLVDGVLLALVFGPRSATVPATALPLPPTSITVPPVVPQRQLAPGRAIRQQAKVRPVLLGPVDIAAFCARGNGPASRPVLLDGEWACTRPQTVPRLADMNAACAASYTADAWAGMLDDTDPQSWRCYTGES
jgi:hypothetical protein